MIDVYATAGTFPDPHQRWRRRAIDDTSGET
jgi:hypothetical protein